MPQREHQHGFDVFGTRARLLLGSGGHTDAPLAALRVQALFLRMHRELTRFDPASALSRLNESAGEVVAVSRTLVQAVGAAMRAAQLSDGLVDPTILPALERAGYAVSRVGVAPAELAEALAGAPPRRTAAAARPACWRQIELDAGRGRMRLPTGLRLDVGGTAKGLAADLAAGMLADRSTFAVDVGGDIRIGGSERAPRTVRVAHPLHDRTVHEFALTAGAVATSGLRTRVWRTPEGFAHHLIDPSRGEPAWTGVIQATALAPTALEAETLAKTALLRGPHAGRAALARHGGALILDDGEFVLVTPTDSRMAA